MKSKFIHTLTLAAALILAAAAAPAQNNPGTESHSVTVPSGSGIEVSTPTATQGTKVTVKYNGGQYVTGLRITPLATRVTINDKESLRYIALGSETTLRSDIYPDLPEVDKTVAWSASPEGIVDLTANGDGTCKLKAVGAGRATIKVTTVTDKTDEIEIVVFVGAKFTVADGKQVMFAPGNLQYNAGETPQWRFAEHQYDICHTTGDNVGDDYKDWKDGEKYKWTDLFGWGTWLSTGGQQPNETQIDDATKYTWSGTSAIGSDWETLTNKEWCYLLSYNSNRLGNFTNDTRKDKYGWGSIVLSENKSVNGMILLPDDWTSKPEGVNTVFKPGKTSGNNAYSVSEWALMEGAGAVFLPAAGYRGGTDVRDVGDGGGYWSSSAVGSDDAWFLNFLSDLVGPFDYDRYYGQSVRLVRRL